MKTENLHIDMHIFEKQNCMILTLDSRVSFGAVISAILFSALQELFVFKIS